MRMRISTTTWAAFDHRLGSIPFPAQLPQNDRPNEQHDDVNYHLSRRNLSSRMRRPIAPRTASREFQRKGLWQMLLATVSGTETRPQANVCIGGCG